MRSILINPALRKSVAQWVAADAAGLTLAMICAESLARRQIALPQLFGGMVSLVVAALGMIGMFAALGLYAVPARYLGVREVVLFFTVLVAADSLFFFSSVVGGQKGQDPLLVPSLFFVCVTLALGGARVIHRRLEVRSLRQQSSGVPGRPSPPTLVVGAGDAGELIIRELYKMPNPTYRVVGIVDDDPKKIGTKIHGVRVMGRTEEIKALVPKLGIEQILIAMPSVEGARIREIAALGRETKAKVVTLPAMQDLIAGKTVVTQARAIDIEDLLRRKPIPTDSNKTAAYVRSEVVLITGGGGSIGSELARQVSRLHPASTIVVGKGENSIFEIEQELRLEGLQAPTAVVADVRDRAAMEAIFEQYRPTVIFHAAAHKHVPLMESNPIEAVRNNVGGTMNMVDLALEYDAHKFILVSTDKAVNPRNVMGATKRVAERIVSVSAGRGRTHMASVRFGNVLGSRGSLVPLLKAQIERGGPVLITHPEMTRYFMTIPEAVQLVLQAGAFGRDGEIFILDMGEPVRVLDLAHDVIRLHGYEPNVTMPIVFTGPRPGEKLHEELTYDVEALEPTEHPKIGTVSHQDGLSWDELRGAVLHLLDLCNSRNSEAVRSLLMGLADGRALPQVPRVVGRAVVSEQTDTVRQS